MEEMQASRISMEKMTFLFVFQRERLVQKMLHEEDRRLLLPLHLQELQHLLIKKTLKNQTIPHLQMITHFLNQTTMFHQNFLFQETLISSNHPRRNTKETSLIYIYEMTSMTLKICQLRSSRRKIKSIFSKTPPQYARRGLNQRKNQHQNDVRQFGIPPITPLLDLTPIERCRQDDRVTINQTNHDYISPRDRCKFDQMHSLSISKEAL